MDLSTFSFNKDHVVATYRSASHLQKPEETVLNHLAPQLSGFSMLDLGVGGGRTTLHFAKWVKDYQGVDISDNMIRACESRFSQYPIKLTFKVGDAANLDWIDSNSKDFVLFSYNGIDCVDHETRQKILSEINRVLKAGGYFLFSSHNLLAIEYLFSLKKQWSRNPINLFRRLRQCLLLNFKYNDRKQIRNLKKQPFAVINDGSYDYTLSTYYITPSEQLKQLNPYFNNVKVFSITSGLEISGELKNNKDAWIYYLCRKPASRRSWAGC